MKKAARELVRKRADNRCEYCQLEQHDSPLAALHIEHIIPRKHGGGDDEQNLALACIDCNLHKGSNLSGLDPETDELSRLFDPRSDHWNGHFHWSGPWIVGDTSIGRTTVRVLNVNSNEQLELRMTE